MQQIWKHEDLVRHGPASNLRSLSKGNKYNMWKFINVRREYMSKRECLHHVQVELDPGEAVRLQKQEMVAT